VENSCFYYRSAIRQPMFAFHELLVQIDRRRPWRLIPNTYKHLKYRVPFVGPFNAAFIPPIPPRKHSGNARNFLSILVYITKICGICSIVLCSCVFKADTICVPARRRNTVTAHDMSRHSRLTPEAVNVRGNQIVVSPEDEGTVAT
jgi:hypothetical protein